MKTLFTIFLTLAILEFADAQSLTGKALYKSSASISFDASGGGKEMSDQERAQMQKALKKALQRDFQLDFNLKESSWKEMESLDDAPTVSSGGMNITFKRSNSVLYKNTQDRISKESNEIFGKAFLIEDTLENYQWKLENEYKQIGQYKCQKATYETTRTRSEIQFEGENMTSKEVVDTVNVTVWFTTQIPVNHGPGQYWGLPGLIMEASNGRMNFICAKIELNSTEEIEIEKPEKGEKVTREEFEKIQQKKMEEMSQQYRGKGEQGAVIRIGG